jgi:hypothetical protein
MAGCGAEPGSRVEGVFRPPGESGSAAVRRQRKRVAATDEGSQSELRDTLQSPQRLTEPQAPAGRQAVPCWTPEGVSSGLSPVFPTFYDPRRHSVPCWPQLIQSSLSPIEGKA